MAIEGAIEGSTEGARAPTLYTVQALRFIAAMAVACVHIPIIKQGHWGVDLFFVISGFIMMYATAAGSPAFFLKRIIRVAPIYWLCTLAVFAIATVAPGLLKNTSADWLHLLKSLLFIPFDKNGAGHFPVLFVGWTLNFEMFYYAIFAVALRIDHARRSLIAGLALLAVVLICRAAFDAFPFMVYGETIMLEFILGMAAYHIIYWDKRSLGVVAILLAAYALPLATDFGLIETRGYRAGVVCFAAFVIAVKLRPLEAFAKPFAPLGDASYALYLTHAYVIGLLNVIFLAAAVNVGWGVWQTAFALTACVIASLIVWRYVERPMSAGLTRLFRVGRPA